MRNPFKRASYLPIPEWNISLSVPEETPSIKWQRVADDLAEALYHTWYKLYDIDEGEDTDDHFAADALKAYDKACDPVEASFVAWGPDEN